MSSSIAPPSDLKDRQIAQLRQEAEDTNGRDREYRSLYDEMVELQRVFTRLQTDKSRMDDDYRQKIDQNLG